MLRAMGCPCLRTLSRILLLIFYRVQSDWKNEDSYQRSAFTLFGPRKDFFVGDRIVRVLLLAKPSPHVVERHRTHVTVHQLLGSLPRCCRTFPVLGHGERSTVTHRGNLNLDVRASCFLESSASAYSCCLHLFHLTDTGLTIPSRFLLPRKNQWH